MYVRYPLSMRNAEDLLHERGIDITHEAVRFNNRAENSHQPFRRRERAMLRFRRMQSLQKFAAVHGSVHNQFASRTFGSTRNDTSHPGQHSRNAAPPLSPSGVSFARPDPCRGRALSETFLVCLTAPPVLPTRGGLVNEGGDDGSTCQRCAHHGDLAQGQARCPPAPLDGGGSRSGSSGSVHHSQQAGGASFYSGMTAPISAS